MSLIKIYLSLAEHKKNRTRLKRFNVEWILIVIFNVD